MPVPRSVPAYGSATWGGRSDTKPSWGLRKRYIKVDIEIAHARKAAGLCTAAVPGVGWSAVPRAMWLGEAGRLFSPGAPCRRGGRPARVLRGQDQAGDGVPPEAVEGQTPLSLAWWSLDRPAHDRRSGQDCRSAAGALAPIPPESSSPRRPRPIEPCRDCRRLFCLSHATIASSLIWAL